MYLQCFFEAIGCENGTIVMHHVAVNTVHGVYRDRYAFRENMTDVVIQHLISDDKGVVIVMKMLRDAYS